MTTTTEGFAGYTCWDPETIQHVIHVDAASPDDAVFLATHQPMTIIERPLRGSTESRYVSEEDLYEAFLSPNQPMMMMPIIGGSGTGKSHLVRWLQARIGTDDPSRRVVYVPKVGTSLRKVIELILEGMEGDQADQLREDLREATERLDEKTAPDAVLDALANRLQHSVPTPTKDPQRDALRQQIREEMPNLLRDPYFRTEFFLRPDGVVQGFVARALRGHRPGDGEAAFEFTVKELQGVTYLPNDDASGPGRNAQNLLRTARPATEAAELLTANLGPAIQSVFGLEGSVSLTDVMMQTRQALAEQGVELILLIEDFTMLQGIQRELLDAIVEPPVRAGRANLCGIRVTLAVTAGYWDSLADTVKTRAAFTSHTYDLNLPVSDGQSSQADIPRFFSRYLNAARLGVDELRTASEGNLTDWVPNACDGCLHKLECHDSFGEVAGVGLYPFNTLAIKRTTDAVTDSDYFDPRAVLGAVLSRTLTEYHDPIQFGTFPNKDYENSFTSTHKDQRALPADVKLDLQRYSDPERRQALLTVWGGCPNEVVDLAAGIHDAFQLPTMGTPLQSTSTEPAEITPPDIDPPITPPSALQRQLDTLDSWADETGDTIDEATARVLRQQLVDALWASVDLNAELLGLDKAQRETLLGQASFDILGAAGGPRPGQRMWSTTIERSAENAAMFKGILQYKEHGSWTFKRAAQALRARLNLLDRWTDDFVDHLDKELRASPNQQEQQFRLLVRDAALLGVEGAASSNWLEVLNAAFSPARTDNMARQDHLARSAKEAYIDRGERIRSTLSTVTAFRGTGNQAYAVDTSTFLKAARRIAAKGLEADGEPLRTGLVEEQGALRWTAQQVDTLTGGQRDAETLVRGLLATLDEAARLGVGDPQVAQLKAEASRWTDFDFGHLDEALTEPDVQDSDDIRAALAALAEQPRMAMGQYEKFLRDALQRLEGSLRRTQTQINRANQDVGVSELERTLDSVISGLEEA